MHSHSLATTLTTSFAHTHRLASAKRAVLLASYLVVRAMDVSEKGNIDGGADYQQYLRLPSRLRKIFCTTVADLPWHDASMHARVAACARIVLVSCFWPRTRASVPAWGRPCWVWFAESATLWATVHACVSVRIGRALWLEVSTGAHLCHTDVGAICFLRRSARLRALRPLQHTKPRAHQHLNCSTQSHVYRAAAWMVVALVFRCRWCIFFCAEARDIAFWGLAIVVLNSFYPSSPTWWCSDLSRVILPRATFWIFT